MCQTVSLLHALKAIADYMRAEYYSTHPSISEGRPLVRLCGWTARQQKRATGAGLMVSGPASSPFPNQASPASGPSRLLRPASGDGPRARRTCLRVPRITCCAWRASSEPSVVCCQRICKHHQPTGKMRGKYQRVSCCTRFQEGNHRGQCPNGHITRM